MATYPDILSGPQDDNNTIDAFQLRSMLPETVAEDSTGTIVLDSEGIFPDELSGPPEDIKFPTYISAFREPAVSSDLPPSVNYPLNPVHSFSCSDV